jgi:hypothetical protein
LKEPELTALSIRGGKTEIPTRARLSLRAIGTYTDGRERELRDGISWSSSDPTIVAVSSTGVVNARRAGRAEIFARAGELSSDRLILTVVTPSPKSPATGAAAKNEGASRVTQINEHIRIARSHRDRGAYAEALDELAKAAKLGAAIKDLQTEIATTKSACRAEIALGRSDLNC